MVDNHWTLASAKPIGNRRSIANDWGYLSKNLDDLPK